MKIEISKAPNPLADLFNSPPTVEGESEALKFMYVEELLGLMKKQGVTRTELARRMEVQPSRVTSMLTGTNNFTIETMVRAARAIGAHLCQKLVLEDEKISWQVWREEDVHPKFRATLREAVAGNVTFELGGQADAGVA